MALHRTLAKLGIPPLDLASTATTFSTLTTTATILTTTP